MSGMKISTHNFNNAKEELKSFSERVPETVDLNAVATSGGLFNWGEHYVTGIEFNTLIEQILSYLTTSNGLHTKSIKEFGQVYKALEALDKDYIQSIIKAIEAAEEASSQAKQSASEAKANSADIEKTIKVQKRTIEALGKFKKRIDSYEHLDQIDELWSEYQTSKEDIKEINELTDLEKKKNEEQNRLLQMKLKISYIIAGSSAGIALIGIVLSVLGIIGVI